MDVRYENRNIVLKVDNLYMAEMEKAYLKQFDGAMVSFRSGPEGDSLVITIAE